ncbi:transmembrane protein 89 [Rhynchocyon petersi]
MLHAGSLLLLLAMPALPHASPQPLWYKVELDLQFWEYQPNSLDGCQGGLPCLGSWIDLNIPGCIYLVAGVTVTTMMLVISRMMLQRRRSQATKGERAQVTTVPCGSWKRRTSISDRTLTLGVLHMLDALMVHLESRLQRPATLSSIQIKGTPTQSGTPGPRISRGTSPSCLSRVKGDGPRRGMDSWVEHLPLEPEDSSIDQATLAVFGYPQFPPGDSSDLRLPNCACAAIATAPAPRLRSAA